MTNQPSIIAAILWRLFPSVMDDAYHEGYNDALETYQDAYKIGFDTAKALSEETAQQIADDLNSDYQLSAPKRIELNEGYKIRGDM